MRSSEPHTEDEINNGMADVGYPDVQVTRSHVLRMKLNTSLTIPIPGWQPIWGETCKNDKGFTRVS